MTIEDIKKEMMKQEMTQADLALKTKIAPSTISHIFNGKRKPSFKTLGKIAKALNMEV